MQTEISATQKKIPGEIVQEVQNLYQDGEYRLISNTLDSDHAQYEAAQKILTAQNGKEAHGFAVLVGAKILISQHGAYRNLREFAETTEIESGLRHQYGPIPDVHDKQYKMILEAGHGLFDGYFVKRCKELIDDLVKMGEHPHYWEFIQIPKVPGFARKSEISQGHFVEVSFTKNASYVELQREKWYDRCLKKNLKCPNGKLHKFAYWKEMFLCRRCSEQIPEEDFISWCEKYDAVPEVMVSKYHQHELEKIKPS